MVLWEALDALSHQLELCNVSADTQLAVLIDPAVDLEQIAEIRAAVSRAGAPAIEIHISPNHCVDNDPLAAALKLCDLVITTGGLGNEPFGIDNPVLHLRPVAPHRFAPHASLRRRVRSLAATLESSSALTLTDSNGTNVTISLVASTIAFDHGFIAADHTRASFPAGWVNVTPAAHTMHGQVVLMPGDANLGARRLISSPVVLQLVDDHISAIEGDNADADVVRALLEHAGERSAYGIAGINIGLNPGPDTPGPFDDRLLDPVVSQLLAGVVQMSFGANLVADRPCRQTISVALRDRTVHVDALPVIVQGRLDGDVAPDVYEL